MSEDYDVGYRKPPKHTRFRKGRSGNPSGRPKEARNLKTELEEELQELISVKEGGVPLIITKQRAMLKRLTAGAVQGDTKAATLLINMINRLLHEDEPEELSEDISAEDQAILERFEKQILDRAENDKQRGRRRPRDE